MSRVHTYSGPFLRGMRGLGQDYTGLNPDGTVDTSWMGSNAPPPTLGPNSDGFAPPASSGALVFPQGIGPNSVTVPTSFTLAQQAQIAQALTPPPQPGTVQALVQSAPGLIVPQPSPTVAVPLSTSTIGLWLSNNLGTVLGIVAVAVVVGSLSGGRKRKR